MMRREGYLRVKEAAELLGVSPNTVRSWGEAGKIPEYRHPVNNYRLYKKAELERILRQAKRSMSARR
jgi:DNA (cytosine-5)-methyltransferase 1